MAKSLPNSRELIILALLIAGEKYGREIRDGYEKRTKRSMPIGSLYTTLNRIEDAGFVTSRTGDPNPERHGNRRKFYKITASEIAALNALQESIVN